jgi:hypothetical protein
MVPSTSDLLLVLPDHIYMWAAGKDAQSEPDVMSNTTAILEEYLPASIKDAGIKKLSQRGLELAVLA